MVSDDTLLGYIDEMLPKLTEKHTKLVDICLRLRAILREKKREGTDFKGPLRSRAAYMRQYRAKQKELADDEDRLRSLAQQVHHP